MTNNACEICKNSVLHDGMCLGLAKDATGATYSQLKPIKCGSSLLKDWVIENSVTNAIIEGDSCNCKSFIKN